MAPTAHAVARPLAFATGVVCLATLLAYGGRWSWFCELLVTFRTHFALLLAPALLLAVLVRRWGIAAVALLGLALNVWPMYGVYSGEPAEPPFVGARNVRVVAFNVNVRNRDMPGIANYLGSLAPDVVVLEEMTAANAGRLVPLLPRLPHRYLAVDEGVRGVLILSRWPLIAPQLLVRGGVMYGARADVDFGDRRLRLYGVHLNWPIVPAAERERNAQLVALGGELYDCQAEHACVVVGDFNTVPWSSHFRDLQEGAGVRDCSAGRGWLPTWNSGLPELLRIRIDHCLASSGVWIAGVAVGESVGSDHLATINDLRVSVVASLQGLAPHNGKRLLSGAHAPQRKTPP